MDIDPDLESHRRSRTLEKLLEGGRKERKKGDDDSNERFIWTVDVAGNGKWSSRPTKTGEMQMNGWLQRRSYTLLLS